MQVWSQLCPCCQRLCEGCTLAWQPAPSWHDCCCAAGAFPVLLDGKLLLLHAAAGSNKLDTARSLNLLAFAASYKFTEKMKGEAVSLLEHLEAWVDKQAQSLDLAQNTERIAGNFDSLLKVLDSLYQVGSVRGLNMQQSRAQWYSH